MAHGFLGPEPLDDFEPLAHAADAVLYIDAHGLKFFPPIAQARGKHVVAIAQPIDGGTFFRGKHRVHHRQQQNARADPHAGGILGQLAEQRHGLEHADRTTQHVLANQQSAKAVVPCGSDLLAQVRQNRLGIFAPTPLRRGKHANSHFILHRR